MMIFDLNMIPLLEMQVGKKAIGFKRLIDLNLAIPKGFVVTKMAFLKLIEINEMHREYNQLINQLLNDKNELILERIRRMIQDISFPNEFSEELARHYHKLCYEPIEVQSAYDLIQNCNVAVRASDENRKMDTFTNVKDKAELLKALKSCWQSYFLESTYSKDNSLAIIVQKMQKTEKSGWADLSPNANIKTIWGQAGFISKFTPDAVLLDINTFNVISKTKGKQEHAYVLENANYVQKILPIEFIHRMVLEDNEIKEIAQTAKLINEKIGICSFEFGISQKKLFILNIRLPVIEEIKEEKEVIDKIEEDNEMLDNLLEPTAKTENTESILDMYEEEQAQNISQETDDEEIEDKPIESTAQAIRETLSFEEQDSVYEEKTDEIMPIEDSNNSEDKSALIAVDKVIDKFKKINPNLNELLDLLAEEIKREIE